MGFWSDRNRTQVLPVPDVQELRSCANRWGGWEKNYLRVHGCDLGKNSFPGCTGEDCMLLKNGLEIAPRPTAAWEHFGTGPPCLHHISAECLHWIGGLGFMGYLMLVRWNPATCSLTCWSVKCPQFLFVCLIQHPPTWAASSCFLPLAVHFLLTFVQSSAFVKVLQLLSHTYTFVTYLPRGSPHGWQLVINEPIQHKQKLHSHLLCKTSASCLVENRTKAVYLFQEVLFRKASLFRTTLKCLNHIEV